MRAEQLLVLLEESFRQWAIDAHVERREGDPWGVVVRAPGRRDLCIARVLEETRGLPAWRFAGPEGGAGTVLVSVRALLRELRLALDPAFVPSRAIIGVRGVRASDPGAPDSGPGGERA